MIGKGRGSFDASDFGPLLNNPIEQAALLRPRRVAMYSSATGDAVQEQVPIGYLYVLAQPLLMRLLVDRRSPPSPASMVHVGNTIHLNEQLGVGERLTVQMTCVNALPDQRGTLLVYESLFWRAGQSGTPVAVQRTALLALSPRGGGVAKSGRPSLPAADQTRAPSVAKIAATRQRARRYALIAQDFNPNHLSVAAARALGFRTMIAPGMWTAATALAAVTDSAKVSAFEVEFLRPVFLPDTLDVLVSEQANYLQAEVWPGGTEKCSVRITASPF